MRVLDSSTGSSEPIFQMHAVLRCHQEILLGTGMKWRGVFVGFFYFQRAQNPNLPEFFPSEAQFVGSTRIIKSLFPVLDFFLFFLRVLGSHLQIELLG